LQAEAPEAEAEASVTTAPAKIIELMEKFERDQDIYRSSQYNETELRTEFINPFFEALGWDVYHKHECRADKREVKEEDAIDVEGKIKSPDYSFRLFDKRKFFVEVKRPSINIESGVYPAYQIRRYAWSADLAISILTDFEEFSVYYCRARPSKDDKSTKSRLLYFRYDQYAEKWPEIVALFSREAVLSGSLDKYVQSLPQKRGDKRVDAALLDDISEWREMLAKSLARHNPLLDTVSLNYAVQTIIDRIIFLRICEDRGIERYLRLKDLLSGERVYPRLCELFLQADDRYNSGIFHFGKEPGRENPDTITPGLQIDDETLKNIIKRLYFPESPYEFSVLPAEILGQIYEQFLGKVIRLDEGHNALVEDKPEVKKAGGVKYTPAYIVEYIVQNTIAPLIKEKTLQEAAALRVLDPACGSGSFLIVAYQHLLDWHKEWYIQNLVPLIESGRMSDIKKLLPAAPPTKGKKGRSREPELPIYQGKGEEWKLTTVERKRILLNNIYGVDIDRQAVEVTKLSLLLKVLEGENEETISKQLKLFAERALPDLSNNIKCGNSLVGWDILKDNPGLSEGEIARINPFDWEREFAEVFLKGGFDVVIGNPPYLRIQGMQEYHGDQIKYLEENYQSAVKRFDFYLLFIERGFRLLNDGGVVGVICPHKFINSDFGSGIRNFLIQNNAIQLFINFGNNLIFKNTSTYTSILVLSKKNNEFFEYYEFPDVSSSEMSVDLSKLSSDRFLKYDLKTLSSDPWALVNKNIPSLLAKLYEQPNTLGDICEEILVGVQSGIDNVYVMKAVGKESKGIIKLFSERINSEVDIEAGLVKPFLRGEDIHRYDLPINSYYCIYPYQLLDGKTKILEESILKEKYPLGYNYLLQFCDELKEIRRRQKTNTKYWYSCHRSRSMSVFESERIITPEISLGCNYTISLPGIYHNTMVYSLVFLPSYNEKILYWLGVLNSNLMWLFLANTGTVLRGGYFRFKTNYLSPFPTRIIDFSDRADVARHDRMVSLVEQMLVLHKQLPEACTPHEKTALERQIEATDGQIDALVYELYGLTEEEIRIVEGSQANK